MGKSKRKSGYKDSKVAMKKWIDLKVVERLPLKQGFQQKDRNAVARIGIITKNLVYDKFLFFTLSNFSKYYTICILLKSWQLQIIAMF